MVRSFGERAHPDLESLSIADQETRQTPEASGNTSQATPTRYRCDRPLPPRTASLDFDRLETFSAKGNQQIQDGNHALAWSIGTISSCVP